MNSLLNEYHVDLRRDLLQLIHKDELYDLSDRLLSDNAALITLSSYAINTICITEILFPRKRNVFALLTRKALHFSGNPDFIANFSSHIIINDTNYYTRDLTRASLPIYRPLLERCAKLIEQNLTQISLETKLAFLVASKILNASQNPSVNAIKNQSTTWPQSPTGFLPLVQKISIECQANLKKSPFLLDVRQPHKNTLESAEPRNLFFILSGLDA